MTSTAVIAHEICCCFVVIYCCFFVVVLGFVLFWISGACIIQSFGQLFNYSTVQLFIHWAPHATCFVLSLTTNIYISPYMDTHTHTSQILTSRVWDSENRNKVKETWALSNVYALGTINHLSSSSSSSSASPSSSSIGFLFQILNDMDSYAV